MLLELLKSFLIGVCAAVPFGPVLIMVVQKTLTGSRRLGFCSGLGSMCIDTLYATVGLFALGVAQAFLQAHQTPILTAGGVVLAFIGVMMMRKKVQSPDVPVGGESVVRIVSHRLKDCLAAGGQTALCALSNPGAILMIAVLLAAFRLESKTLSIPVWTFALAVAAGEASYWLALTALIRRFGSIKTETMQKITRIAGMLIIGFGIFLLVKGLIDLL